jgi:hypothetical protein
MVQETLADCDIFCPLLIDGVPTPHSALQPVLNLATCRFFDGHIGLPMTSDALPQMAWILGYCVIVPYPNIFDTGAEDGTSLSLSRGIVPKTQPKMPGSVSKIYFKFLHFFADPSHQVKCLPTFGFWTP